MAMEDLENILDAFEKGVKGNRATMNEGTFEEVFKPVFEGRIGENTRLIEKWVELAGDEYSPVDLLDANGEVVATVSGILRPLPKENRENYRDIMARFETATSVLRINPVRSKAMMDNVDEELKQGLLPSNAKSRSYITYYREDDKVDVDKEDNLYDL